MGNTECGPNLSLTSRPRLARIKNRFIIAHEASAKGRIWPGIGKKGHLWLDTIYLTVIVEADPR
jgi:hypothetical protein